MRGRISARPFRFARSGSQAATQGSQLAHRYPYVAIPPGQSPFSGSPRDAWARAALSTGVTIVRARHFPRREGPFSCPYRVDEPRVAASMRSGPPEGGTLTGPIRGPRGCRAGILGRVPCRPRSRAGGGRLCPSRTAASATEPEQLPGWLRDLKWLTNWTTRFARMPRGRDRRPGIRGACNSTRSPTRSRRTGTSSRRRPRGRRGWGFASRKWFRREQPDV